MWTERKNKHRFWDARTALTTAESRKSLLFKKSQPLHQHSFQPMDFKTLWVCNIHKCISITVVWIEQPRKESEDFGCCYKWACRPAQCGVRSCLSRSGRPSDLNGKLDCFSWITLDMSKHNLTVAVLDLCCHPWSCIEVLILNPSLPRGQRKTNSHVKWVCDLETLPSTDH